MADPSLPPRRPPIGATARDLLVAGRALLADARWVANTSDDIRRGVLDAYRTLVDPQLRERLAEIDVDRLRETTGGRLRVTPVREAGYRSVLDILDAPPSRLDDIPGVGQQTALGLRAAAAQVADAVASTVSVQIVHDPENRQTTPLIVAMHRLATRLPGLKPLATLNAALVTGLSGDLRSAEPTASMMRWLFTGGRNKAAASGAYWRIDQAVRWASETGVAPKVVTLRQLDAQPTTPSLAWAWFASDPAGFYSLLGEAVGLTLDAAAVEGFVPSEIVAKIEALKLDDTYADVTLRGYQSFGARYALVQKRVILGDEMGLGKTIQALAGLAHLRARGASRFLVVCPASVLVNWLREVHRHTRLDFFRLQGDGRDQALADWLARGGVGVTTYETLGVLPLAADLRLDALVVDEAHFVKNPDAKRSRLVADLGSRASYAWYLTGTPMENKVAEFGDLVANLQPATVVDVTVLDGLVGPKRFRAAVAPVYLRRNAEDVLVELPPLVQTDEWVTFTRPDAAAYRLAVQSGNFSAMRRAAWSSTDPDQCAKVERLLELVAEARASGRRVVIFSFFLGVVSTVAASLQQHGHASDMLGPLTGSTPVADRQTMVDALAAPEGPGILVAQIQAGGIGLNLQAASVVILCEPQVKPTMETQAIARAHRMGQLDTVQVHRLLGDDSVDERMLEILSHKEALFDSYARPSDMAAATPASVDVSEVALARQVIAAEQGRLQFPLR